MKKVQNTRYKKFPVNETATRFFLRSATASRHVRVKLLVLDSSRSYDTARLGLPTAYIYRYVVVQQLYLPLGRQLSVTPASMGLFPIAMT